MNRYFNDEWTAAIWTISKEIFLSIAGRLIIETGEVYYLYK
ncbi:MAG: hypothetical protein ABI416_01040 [Ginsengibacter sp.]